MITTTGSSPSARLLARLAASFAVVFFIFSIAAPPAHAQQPLIIERSGETIVLEPYPPTSSA